MINFAAEQSPGIRRILCLGAHCDDIEIGCGGALLTLLADQHDDIAVDWVVFSSSPQRKLEAAASAAEFLSQAESSDIQIENFRNGYFPSATSEIKDFFEGLKSLPAPDLIFTHYRSDRHQDHRVIAELTWNTFRDHQIMEYEIPKYDGDLGRPNIYFPISADISTRKASLILDHFQSQKDKQWFSADTFTSMTRLRGIECNSSSGYAEAFHAQKVVICP